MCEWTPPYETSPSRWTSPSRSSRAPERAEERVVLEERAVLDGAVHAHEVLEEDPARADRQVADLGVPHLARRAGRPPRPRRAASCADSERRARRRPACRASSTALPGPGGAIPQPSRITSVTSGSPSRAHGRAARQIASNDGGLERGTADERAVDVRLGEQLGGVLRLDGAAVEDTRVVQRLDRTRAPPAPSPASPSSRCRSPTRARRRSRGARAAGSPPPGGASTASVSPASRSASVSPTQAITESPASSAASRAGAPSRRSRRSAGAARSGRRSRPRRRARAASAARPRR